MPSTTSKRGTHPRIRDARPDLLDHTQDPDTVGALTLGSNKKIRWTCTQGHQWTATPCDIVIGGHWCPYCSGRLPIPGETDLATTHPNLAAQLVDTDPTHVTHASMKRLSWRCPVGHEWQATVANRATKGSGCPYCSGRSAVPGVTDLATTDPELAAQLVDADPTTFSRSSNRAVAWRCHLEHTWTQTPNARTNTGSGCPYCAEKRILPGFNDLATLFPHIAAELVNDDPTIIGRANHSKRLWRCTECAQEWTTSVATRTKSGGRAGCSGCRERGFKATRPAYLYLLTRTKGRRTQLKVGITGDLRTRLGRHRTYGWALLDTSPPMPGSDVLRLEQDFLRHLDTLGVPRGVRGARGEPGFTETWDSADYPLDSIKTLIATLTQAKAA